MKLAQQGKFSQFQQLLGKQKNVENDFQKVVQKVKDITQNGEYNSFILREDFDNGKQWNDSAIASAVRKVFQKEKKKRDLQYEETDPGLEETWPQSLVSENDINENKTNLLSRSQRSYF